MSSAKFLDRTLIKVGFCQNCHFDQESKSLIKSKEYRFLIVRLLKPETYSWKLPFFLCMNNIRAPVGDLKSPFNKIIIDTGMLKKLRNRVFLMSNKTIIMLGKKDKYSWSPKPSHKGFYYCPLRTAANFFALKSFTRLVVYSRISSPDKLFANHMFAQLKMMKGIPKTRLFPFWYRPLKKWSSKKIKPFLAYPKAKTAMTLPKVSKCNLLLFWA